jgi:hypothetical protein
MPIEDPPDWWRDEEALDAMHDAAREAQRDSELDAVIQDVHAWLDKEYGRNYVPGQVDLCFQALFLCQAEKVPPPAWVIDALKAELELAGKRSSALAQLHLAAQEANKRRQAEAEQQRAWFIRQAADILERNPRLSENSLAEILAERVKGTERAAAPRTVRRHIAGISAKR